MKKISDQKAVTLRELPVRSVWI